MDTQQRENKELAEQMASLAENAVTLASDQHQTKLDYSEDSLTLVEDILAKLSKDVPKSWFSRVFRRGPSRQQIESICAIIGAYVGEVIRRKWGGTWHMDSTFGRPLCALSVLGGDVFPTNKVYKRLVHGESDNIWTYYQMLKQMHENGPPDL